MTDLHFYANLVTLDNGKRTLQLTDQPFERVGNEYVCHFDKYTTNSERDYRALVKAAPMLLTRKGNRAELRCISPDEQEQPLVDLSTGETLETWSVWINDPRAAGASTYLR